MNIWYSSLSFFFVLDLIAIIIIISIRLLSFLIILANKNILRKGIEHLDILHTTMIGHHIKHARAGALFIVLIFNIKSLLVLGISNLEFLKFSNEEQVWRVFSWLL